MTAEGATTERVIHALVHAADPAVGAGHEASLRAAPLIDVRGRSSDPAELGRLVRQHAPDLLLLDIGAHEAGLLELAGGGAALLVVTDLGDGMWVSRLLRARARALLPRGTPPAAILAAATAAAGGLVVLHPDALAAALPPTGRNAFDGPLGEPFAEASAQALTPRETEILTMLAEGTGNKVMARRLGISDHTVKFHLSSIFAKLGARSRTEAVTMGARLGLILL